jgi:hypothetical protein
VKDRISGMIQRTQSLSFPALPKCFRGKKSFFVCRNLQVLSILFWLVGHGDDAPAHDIVQRALQVAGDVVLVFGGRCVFVLACGSRMLCFEWREEAYRWSSSTCR